jgi:hypothetical protein
MSVHARSNLAARHRWDLEEANRDDKHLQHMTDALSLNWTAIKNWNLLMLLGMLLRTLPLYSIGLWRLVQERGVRATIEFLKGSYAGRWLDLGRLRAAAMRPAQLRLVW